MMKILVAHNFYSSRTPSGENEAVLQEVKQLGLSGIDVELVGPSSDSLLSARDIARASLGPIYSPDGVRQFKRILRSFKPHLVHVHNVYPLLSPWIVRTAKSHGLPVVQTMHNYRLSCVNG